MPMEGYAKLAQLMGNSETGGHYHIFQTFESLSAQNLLYLQAEIIHLRNELKIIADADFASDDEDRQVSTIDWLGLISSSDDRQWQKWLTLRSTIKEYYEAIAQHNIITNLPKPNKHNLTNLQDWLERPSMGGCKFIGADRHVYEHPDGLVTLAPRSGEVNLFTRTLLFKFPILIQSLIVTPFHSITGYWLKKPMEQSIDLGSTSPCFAPAPVPEPGFLQNADSNESSANLPIEVPHPEDSSLPSSIAPLPTPSSPEPLDPEAHSALPPATTLTPDDSDLEAQMFVYADSSLHMFATLVSTAICALIPIGAIVVLYCVTSMPARLGVIAVFTVIFAICLTMGTEARQVEVFAATAA